MSITVDSGTASIGQYTLAISVLAPDGLTTYNNDLQIVFDVYNDCTSAVLSIDPSNPVVPALNSYTVGDPLLTVPFNIGNIVSSVPSCAPIEILCPLQE